MPEIRKISGFRFVKVGQFLLSDKPYQFKNWTSKIVLSLYDKKYEKADETVYLVMSDHEILYVGEFTYNLKDRWISKNHVNHHMHNNIEELLTRGKNLSIWLAISPYCETPEIGELNISKSLEQWIMREYQPKWNSRSKSSESKEWRCNNCIRIDSFIKP